jgi:hypothetical protein
MFYPRDKHDTSEKVQLQFEKDPCFYAEDGEGNRMSWIRRCAPCKLDQPQRVWPGDVTRGTLTSYIYTFYSAQNVLGFPGRRGKLHVPRWFVASSLWCFTGFDTSYADFTTVDLYLGKDGVLYEGFIQAIKEGDVFPRILLPHIEP